MTLELRYHAAMPNWAKLVGLKVKAVPECEGGGFAIDKAQAEAIVGAGAVLDRIATWFEQQAARSDETAIRSSRFPSLADACRADALNYRAMARDARTALSLHQPKR